MEDIAREAGASQGLAYRYYANKDALFARAVEDVTQRGLASLAHLRDAELSPRRRLEALLTRMVDMRREEPHVFLLIQHVQDQESGGERASPAGGRQDRFLDELEQLIQAAQDSRELPPGDPKGIALAVGACLEGLVRLASRQPKDDLSRLDARIVLRLLG